MDTDSSADYMLVYLSSHKREKCKHSSASKLYLEREYSHSVNDGEKYVPGTHLSPTL